jgi:hypothetical protein
VAVFALRRHREEGMKTDTLEGRERDAAVARALGWDVRENAGNRGEDVWVQQTPVEPWWDCPAFSTDLNACDRWIWPDCRRRGWEVQVNLGGDSVASCMILDETGDGWDTHTEAESDHPATALCRAYVLAVGVTR